MRRARRLVVLLITCAALSAGGAAAQRTVPAGIRPFVSISDTVVALVGVRVVDGTGGPAQSGQTVLIRGNRIAAVGPSASVPVPPGARVMSLPGHSVIPGYVMLHEHMFYPVGEGAYNQQEFSFPKLYLAGGATTIRTGGGRDPYGDLNLKEAVDADLVPGPRIHATSAYINAPGVPYRFMNALKDAEDARTVVRYWIGEGATSIKTYSNLTRAEMRATIEEAHAHGVKVTGDLCSITFREAVDFGIDNLEHGFHAATDFVKGKRPDECPDRNTRNLAIRDLDLNGPEFRSLVKHLVDHRVALTSTLTVFETGTPGRPVAPQGALDAMNAAVRDLYLRAWVAVQQQPTVTDAALLAKKMAMDKIFADAGGMLVAGTDPTGYGGVVAGYSNQREVELLRESGFTPEQAIRIATLNGATFLGVADQLGTVQAGKLADLIVLEGDPTSDISAVRNVRVVFKDGLGYDPARLIDAAKGSVGLR